MLMLLLPVLGMHFVLRDIVAQSVTQPDIHVTVPEGTSLELRCNYSYGAKPYIFWYIQYSGQDHQLLLKLSEKGSCKGFEATYKRETTSFHLEKSSVRESDGTVYYCTLSDTVAETTEELSTKIVLLS
uniref:Ig-like domain-containing protein n=1 Tax=Castor canadensis TaxID=51338 RepID=A0A8C0ZSF4_CASCN